MATQVGTTLVFGIGATSTLGLIQSVTLGSGGTKKEYRDESGEVKNITTYDTHETINMSVLFLASATRPTIGATFTYDGTTYYVDSADVAYQNEDMATLSITGRTYPSISA